MNNSNKAVKARVTKRIQWILLACMMISIPVFIGYYIWANSFLVIVPPGKYDSTPNGAILWSYWENRQDQLMSPDFIDEFNLENLTVLIYKRLAGESEPLRLPYNKLLHEIVSGDIGESVFDVIPDEKQEKKQEQVIEPEMKELDNWQIGETEIC